MTSIGLQHPQFRSYHRQTRDRPDMRYAENGLLATGLLALMIVIAIVTHLEPSPGWLVHLVRAGAEAGIVGGLADWCAPTGICLQWR
jgi:hypothetical protein